MKHTLLSLSIFAVILATAAAAFADNIDLSTIPPRQTVQLTIYNGEDITLVRDTRTITFVKGDNPLEFSWTNTLIDPSSVHLNFLTHQNDLHVTDTVYPHDRKQTLYWHVNSNIAGPVTLRITYFTSGISWRASYQATVAPDEKAMRLRGFVTVTNQSGEDYENAHVRLVVGHINMVQAIRQLAQRGMAMADATRRGRESALGKSVARYERLGAKAASGPLSMAQARKQIIKQGQSEYFIFTIPGTETIPNQWSKRMQSLDAKKVPVALPYRYWPEVYGNQLARVLTWTNDDASHLGESPLPNGMVYVYQKHDLARLRARIKSPIADVQWSMAMIQRLAAGRLGYLGRQSMHYVPVAGKVDLSLGADPNVRFKLIEHRIFRDNLWARFGGVAALHRIDKPGFKLVPHSSVRSWDEHVVYLQRIRNDTDRAIKVQVRRTYAGDVTFRSELGAANDDYNTVAYSLDLASGAAAELAYEVITTMGDRAKQDRVLVKRGKPRTASWYVAPVPANHAGKAEHTKEHAKDGR